MPPVDPERFAAVAGAALRQLPVPAAPSTLLPRVMAAAQQWARRPWYARAWFTWPPVPQVASIAAFCATVAGAAVLLLRVEDALAALSISTAGRGGAAAAISGYLVATTNVAPILWRTIIRPMVPYAAAFGALMCLACAAFGAALNQVAFSRTVQP